MNLHTLGQWVSIVLFLFLSKTLPDLDGNFLMVDSFGKKKLVQNSCRQTFLSTPESAEGPSLCTVLLQEFDVWPRQLLHCNWRVYLG